MHLEIPPYLETARLTMRRLQPEDAEEIFYTYASKPEATQFVAWPTHERLEMTRGYLAYANRAWDEGTDFTWSIRLKYPRRLIGSCGVIHQQGTAQLGYILGPTHWGQGYATECCRAVVDCLSRVPELYRIFTYVDVDNTASIRVLEKTGFKEVARLPKWYRFVNQDNAAKDCILFRHGA